MTSKFGRALLGVLCCTLVSSPALADDKPTVFFPGHAGGWITVAGGVRWIYQGDVGRYLAQHGNGLSGHDAWQPAVLLGATSQFQSGWAVRAELGWSLDRYRLRDDTTVAIQTIAAQLALEWMPPLNWGRVQPYLDGGIGYYFSGVTEPVGEVDSTDTTSATGVSLAIGARIALTTGLGFSVEDRYALAFAGLGSLGTGSVGGNTFTVGMYFGWK